MSNWTADYRRWWYGDRRSTLVKKLGGKCVHCGSTRRLEIDHIHGRDYVARELSSNQRLCLYFREAREGKVQLLCKRCNVLKGSPGRSPESWTGKPTEDIPF